MAVRVLTDLRGQRAFWYSYFTLGFGALGPSFDEEVLAACFGVSDAAALAWWNDFTGWYDGVLDEADGAVDEPGLAEVVLAGGDRLVVEAHPGDVYLHRRSTSGSSDRLANFGPHWFLPGWSLAGALRLAASSGAAFLLLAPLVVLKTDDACREATVAFADAAVRGAGVHDAAAAVLAAEWVRCATRDEYP